MLPGDIKVLRLINSSPGAGMLAEDPLLQRISSMKVDELSGGERKYLEVMLLFGLDRRYFLLDEPFTGVEPVIIERLMEKIKIKVTDGKGILVTDHYHQYVSEVADYAYLMQNKQCYDLGSDFQTELKMLQYIK